MTRRDGPDLGAGAGVRAGPARAVALERDVDLAALGIAEDERVAERVDDRRAAGLPDGLVHAAVGLGDDPAVAEALPREPDAVLVGADPGRGMRQPLLGVAEQPV